jgi:hypothetical protein
MFAVSSSFVKKPTFQLLRSSEHAERQQLRSGYDSCRFFRVKPGDDDLVPKTVEGFLSKVANDLNVPLPQWHGLTHSALNEYQCETQWVSEYAGIAKQVLDHLAPQHCLSVQLPLRALHGNNSSGDASNLRLDVSVGRKSAACMRAEARVLEGRDELDEHDDGSGDDLNAGPDEVDCSIEFKTDSVLGDQIFEALDLFHAGGGAAKVFKNGSQMGVIIDQWPAAMADNYCQWLRPLAYGLVHVVDSATLSVVLATPYQLRSNGNRSLAAWFDEEHSQIQWSTSFGRRRNGRAVNDNVEHPPLITCLLAGVSTEDEDEEEGGDGGELATPLIDRLPDDDSDSDDKEPPPTSDALEEPRSSSSWAEPPVASPLLASSSPPEQASTPARSSPTPGGPGSPLPSMRGAPGARPGPAGPSAGLRSRRAAVELQPQASSSQRQRDTLPPSKRGRNK